MCTSQYFLLYDTIFSARRKEFRGTRSRNDPEVVVHCRPNCRAEASHLACNTRTRSMNFLATRIQQLPCCCLSRTTDTHTQQFQTRTCKSWFPSTHRHQHTHTKNIITRKMKYVVWYQSTPRYQFHLV